MLSLKTSLHNRKHVLKTYLFSKTKDAVLLKVKEIPNNLFMFNIPTIIKHRKSFDKKRLLQCYDMTTLQCYDMTTLIDKTLPRKSSRLL